MNTTRHIPPGYAEYKPEIGDYPKEMFAAYVYPSQDRTFAMFFSGKQSKPAWHYRFKTMTDAGRKINESISRLMSWEEMKTERKEKRKEEKKTLMTEMKVGDLYAYSWGYEQTNVDFFQVTEVKGSTFTIREIGGKHCGEAPSGYMSDYVIAVKDSFIPDKEPIVKRGLSMDFGLLSKTNEVEKHFSSWYA